MRSTIASGIFFKFSLDYLVILGIIIYVLAAASVSLNRFWQFDAFWYDLGLYDGAIWKVANFQLPVVEQFGPPDKLIFADHFNPSLFLLSPIYWFTDRTEALLVLQAALVGGGAWFAYLIARKNLASRLATVALLFAYLGFVGLQNALYTDFHDTTVATFFVMFLFWTIFNRRWCLFWLSFIIVLGFKESMAGLGVGIGLYLVLTREREIKRGLFAIALSVLWYLAATRIIIPSFSGASFAYEPIWPISAKQAILAFFEPASLKVRTLFFSFLTFGFAPLFSLATMPVVLEHYLERFVLSPSATRWDLGLHYNALISPLFFVASLPFCRLLLTRGKVLINVWSLALIVVVIFLHRFLLHGPLLLATDPIFYR